MQATKNVSVKGYLTDYFWPTIQKYPEDKYSLLKAAASFNPKETVRVKDDLKKIRDEFIDLTVMRKEMPLADNCFLCNKTKQDINLNRHHIVALKHWGVNRRYNLVTLCDRCHEYMHPWLRTAREKREAEAATHGNARFIYEALEYLGGLERDLITTQKNLHEIRLFLEDNQDKFLAP